MDRPFPDDMMPDIERFFEGEKTRRPGEDLYEDVFKTRWFFPLQRRCELERMIRLARRRDPKVVMEIGCDKAGGFYHWCKCLPTVNRAVGCEVRGTPYASLFERAFPHIDFLWLPKSSYAKETVREVGSWLGTDKIDVLFIDGDKSRFVTDFDIYLSYVSDNGIVFTHDVKDEAPGNAFREIRSRGYKTDIIIDTSDTDWAVRRGLLGIEPESAHEGWLRHWEGRSCGVGVIYPNERRVDGGTRADNNKHSVPPHIGGA